MFLDVEFDSTASSEALGGVQRVLFCWEELARVRAEVVVAENSHEPLALRVEQRGCVRWTDQNSRRGRFLDLW